MAKGIEEIKKFGLTKKTPIILSVDENTKILKEGE